MTSEDRVMAIFVEANPAPDVESLPIVESEAAGYLATLEQRRSEVTQIEAKKSEDKKKRSMRKGWMVAAAAFVGVVAVALFLTSAGRSDAPVATNPPPTTPLATEPSIVGDWEAQVFPPGWLMSFSASGRFDVSSPLGISTGTYEVNGSELKVTTLESTIDTDEEFPNCIGLAIFDLTFDDANTVNLGWVDGKCDGSWPSLRFRMLKTEYGRDQVPSGADG